MTSQCLYNGAQMMEIYLQAYDSKLPVNQSHDYQHEAAWRLLRYALDRSFHLNADIVFETGLSGKPYIAGRPDCQFSLSHTEGLLACSISNRPTGIDVERIGTLRPSVIRRFNGEEQNFINHAVCPEEAFMRVWTMKEAYVKLTGAGMAGLFDIHCVPGRPLPDVSYRQFIWQGRYVITVCEIQKGCNQFA